MAPAPQRFDAGEYAGRGSTAARESALEQERMAKRRALEEERMRGEIERRRVEAAMRIQAENEEAQRATRFQDLERRSQNGVWLLAIYAKISALLNAVRCARRRAET